jgi:hypothetical protein
MSKLICAERGFGMNSAEDSKGLPGIRSLLGFVEVHPMRE